MKLLKNWNKVQFQAVVWFILAIAIFGQLPIGRFAALPMARAKIVLLEWGIWIFVALFFLKDKWLKSWFIWVLLCLIMQYNKYSYGFANTVLLYVLFYQVLVDRLDDRKTEAILNGICMIVWFHMCWVVLQWQGMWWLYKYESLTKGHVIFGVLANSNNAGMLIALSIPAFLRKKWCWLLLAILPSLYLTKSEGSIIVALVGLAVFSFVRFPKWRIGIALFPIVFFALYIFCVGGKELFIGAIKHRFDAWYRMWKLIRVNLVKGLGLSQYRNVFPAIDRVIFGGGKWSWFRAHNIYVELAFEQGLIGLGLMAEFVCSNIERYLKGMKTRLGLLAFTGVVMSLICGATHFIAQTSSMVIPIIYVAVMVNQTKGVNNVYSKNRN